MQSSESAFRLQLLIFISLRKLFSHARILFVRVVSRQSEVLKITCPLAVRKKRLDSALEIPFSLARGEENSSTTKWIRFSIFWFLSRFAEKPFNEIFFSARAKGKYFSLLGTRNIYEQKEKTDSLTTKAKNTTSTLQKSMCNYMWNISEPSFEAEFDCETRAALALARGKCF